ncbi:MAG TPA: HAMP domain-containing protein, partial [Solirubrobacteraceae bacterium]|nr:HAMP domain-containing protein [Solirubrobacteraceae bacterium]
MSFRRRIALAAAAAVAVAVVLASALTYALTSNQLHSQLDSQLRNRGREVGRVFRLLGQGAPTSAEGPTAALSPPVLTPEATQGGGASVGSGVRTRGIAPSGAGNLFGRLPSNPDQVRGYQQVVDASGRILARSYEEVSLPVDRATRLLAAHGGAPHFSDVRVNGQHLRVLAEPFGAGRAVQLAQPLTEVDSLLSRLRLILVLLDVGGIALAALLGTLVAGAAVQPLRRLTEATEHVTATSDLSRRIEPAGGDEIGRLAASFNAMLDALERSMRALDASVHAQRQL